MMSHYKIAVIVGSFRRDSINQKLANALTKMAPAEFEFIFANIGDMPLYNQDDEKTPGAAVKKFKAEIASVQALLFVTPEFNRSIPGALKNAIDQGSRPSGDSVWTGKPAGIIGASPGNISTAVAQQHLRNVLVGVGVQAMSQPEGFVQIRDGFFDESGGVANTDTRKFLQSWMDRYIAWLRKTLA